MYLHLSFKLSGTGKLEKRIHINPRFIEHLLCPKDIPQSIDPPLLPCNEVMDSEKDIFYYIRGA